MPQSIDSLSLLHHLQPHTGEHRGTETKPHNGPHSSYSLELFTHPTADMITIVSNGLRHIETNVPFGEEIACTLRKTQAGYARMIIGAICELITQRHTGIEYDQILDNTSDLFDTTHKQGLLASTHPYFNNSFNYLTSDATTDNVQLQIITLIPITRAEIEPATHDTDTFYEHWDKLRLDFLDINRPSAL